MLLLHEQQSRNAEDEEPWKIVRRKIKGKHVVFQTNKSGNVSSFHSHLDLGRPGDSRGQTFIFPNGFAGLECEEFK